MSDRKEYKKARKRAKELARDVGRGDTNTAIGKLLDDVNRGGGVPATGDSLRKMFGVPVEKKK